MLIKVELNRAKVRVSGRATVRAKGAVRVGAKLRFKGSVKVRAKLNELKVELRLELIELK